MVTLDHTSKTTKITVWLIYGCRPEYVIFVPVYIPLIYEAILINVILCGLRKLQTKMFAFVT